MFNESECSQSFLDEQTACENCSVSPPLNIYREQMTNINKFYIILLLKKDGSARLGQGDSTPCHLVKRERENSRRQKGSEQLD